MLKRELSDWPGGVESVWPLLDAESIRALRATTPPDNRVLRVSSELEEEELAGSAFVGNAMVLLRAAAEEGEPLRVTSNGTLSLASVARMRAAMTWPDMEATEHFRDGTKYRVRDLWELDLLRRMVQKTGLVERGARSFELTVQGRRMLDAGALRAQRARKAAAERRLRPVAQQTVDTAFLNGWIEPDTRDYYLKAVTQRTNGIEQGIEAFNALIVGMVGEHAAPSANRYRVPPGYVVRPENTALHSQITRRAARDGTSLREVVRRVDADLRRACAGRSVPQTSAQSERVHRT